MWKWYSVNEWKKVGSCQTKSFRQELPSFYLCVSPTAPSNLISLSLICYTHINTQFCLPYLILGFLWVCSPGWVILESRTLFWDLSTPLQLAQGLVPRSPSTNNSWYEWTFNSFWNSESTAGLLISYWRKYSICNLRPNPSQISTCRNGQIQNNSSKKKKKKPIILLD